MHQRYMWHDMKPCQKLISCQVCRWYVSENTYFNKMQKHNFGPTKNFFYRNLSSNKLIFWRKRVGSIAVERAAELLFAHP